VCQKHSYRQNPGVSTILDDKGQIKTINLQKPRKRAVLAFEADVEEAPRGPPPNLIPLEQSNAYLKQAVRNLAKLLEERPVVTRRVAMNLIDWGSESLFKEATQYVAYSFRSGPWKDALIKYGVDPRTDPSYRVYQTLSFQLLSKDKMVAAAKRMPDGKNTWIRSERYRKDEQPSHIFDGKGITTNGKTWQMCDIQEPLLRGLLDTQELRTECDVSLPTRADEYLTCTVHFANHVQNEYSGWYQNGTMSKVRIIMRDMISTMFAAEPLEYQAYQTLATIPDLIDPQTYSGCYFDKDKHGERVMTLSGDIRSVAKTDLTLKLKTRVAADDEEPVVSRKTKKPQKASSMNLDGACEEDEEEEEDGEDEGALVEEIEGDDLNGSDSDDDGADGMVEEE